MLCDRDAYLLELVCYIQLNPARLKNSEEPTTYRWNSRGADSGRKGPVAIDTTLVLNQLGDTPSDANKAHRKFIDDGRGMGHDDRYYQAVDRRFLSNEKFVERIAKLASQGEIGPDGRKLRFEKLRPTVAQVHGYRVDDLTAAGRQCACARSRGQLAYLARDWCALKAIEIGLRLRHDASMVSRLCADYEADQDPKTEKQITELIDE